MKNALEFYFRVLFCYIRLNRLAVRVRLASAYIVICPVMLNITGARTLLTSAYIVICPVMLNITGARAGLASAYIAFGVRTLPLTKKFLTMKVLFLFSFSRFPPLGD